MNEAYQAMRFAMDAHKDQKRKYTNEPYFLHLAEVAGMVATIHQGSPRAVAIAWLHDTVEDCGITTEELLKYFSADVVSGVMGLSDLEEGNRETRKRLSRERHSRQPYWVQDVKVCDLISNTSSIVNHDPEFAKIYLKEKRLLLDVLTEADPDLIAIARKYCEENV